MKAIITTAAIILTTTFATADKPEWIKKLQAEATASGRHSDDFDYDTYDPDKMDLVASVEDRLTIHQLADSTQYDSAKGNNLLIKKGHIALVVQCYGYKLAAIEVFEMDKEAIYQHVKLIHVNIPAKDVVKYAIEYFVNGGEAFSKRYSIVKFDGNGGKHNVDRKPLELKLKTLREEQVEWESEEGEEGRVD